MAPKTDPEITQNARRTRNVLWTTLGHPGGVILGRFWGLVWICFGPFLDSFWDLFCIRFGPFWPSWATLGGLDCVGALLGASGVPPGALLCASWGSVGPSWGPLGPSWCPLGALLGRLGAPLGTTWAVLGRIWVPLGPSLAVGRQKRREP